MTFKTKRLIFTLSPIIFIAVVFILRQYIINMSYNLPQCDFLEMTGLLCPACGNTRALRSMLSLHFFDAVRYNATIPLLCAIILLMYVEKLINIWSMPKKPVRLFPHKFWFYLTILILWLVYTIVRNIFNFMP